MAVYAFCDSQQDTYPEGIAIGVENYGEMVRPARFERATPAFGGRHCIKYLTEGNGI